MALFEMKRDCFEPITGSSLTELKIRERSDLQRLLSRQIELIDENLYVLTEEFGDWEDSRHRIDLLAIDKEANLVVIELKRTADGSYMELQAIRYAAMVSTMTYERAVQIHSEFLARKGEDGSQAEAAILEFLQWEDSGSEEFGSDVKLILVSQGFGIELTTTVLWLLDRDIDIRCIRLVPYNDEGRCLIDVQQIIPLPEASSYVVRIKEKGKQERRQKDERYDIRLRFWQGVVAESRRRNARHANIKPSKYHWLGSSAGIRGLGLNLVVAQSTCSAELYIDRGEKEENKRIFDRIAEHKNEVEERFGAPLQWERLEERRASCIRCIIQSGGYRTPEDKWPDLHRELVESMIELEEALAPELEGLGNTL